MGNARAVIYRRGAVERSTEALDQFMQRHPNQFIWAAVLFVAVSLIYIMISHIGADSPTESAPITLSSPLPANESIQISAVTKAEPMARPAPEPNAKPLEQEAGSTDPNITKATVAPGDSLGKILGRQGFTPAEIHEIAGVVRKSDGHVTIFPGDVFEFFKNPETGLVESVSTENNQHETVKIVRTENGFTFNVEQKQTESETRFKAGTIQNSLFSDASKAGLSDRVIMELAQLFQWEIDFALDIRQGDQFKVIYDDIYTGGEKLRTGPILAAEFVNNNKELRGFRFEHADGSIGYYNEKGESLKKAFLKAPVDFARISSRFSLARKHPVLHKIRAHKGVDYAAARGTPIKATGRGRVTFAGWKGGYGRTVIIQHNEKHSTLYAHLNSFAKGFKQGQRVHQGQIIGTIGSTGLATGPHLHYEFRLNGRQVDPLKVKFPKAQSLAGQEKQAFLQQIADLRDKLKVDEDTQVASRD